MAHVAYTSPSYPRFILRNDLQAKGDQHRFERFPSPSLHVRTPISPLDCAFLKVRHMQPWLNQTFNLDLQVDLFGEHGKTTILGTCTDDLRRHRSWGARNWYRTSNCSLTKDSDQHSWTPYLAGRTWDTSSLDACSHQDQKTPSSHGTAVTTL